MSIAELLVIALVALCVFGPNKLPELAQNIGRLVGKARKLKTQFDEYLHQQQLQLELEKNIKKAEQADKSYEK